MKKAIFCYRISAEAQIASDEQGNPQPAYTQVTAGEGNKIEGLDYDLLQKHIKYSLADNLDLSPDHFESITIEEYDRRVWGEEDGFMV